MGKERQARGQACTGETGDAGTRPAGAVARGTEDRGGSGGWIRGPSA